MNRNLLSDDIALQHRRVRSMSDAVADLDARITKLERLTSSDDRAIQLDAQRQLRTLNDQRANARELLVEAQNRLVESQGAMETETGRVVRELGKIGDATMRAAERFDRSMAEASAALAEIEDAARPLQPALLPTGAIERATSIMSIMAAFRHGFATRLSKGQSHEERESMAVRISRMLADARENSVRLRNREVKAA